MNRSTFRLKIKNAGLSLRAKVFWNKPPDRIIKTQKIKLSNQVLEGIIYSMVPGYSRNPESYKLVTKSLEYIIKIFTQLLH